MSKSQPEQGPDASATQGTPSAPVTAGRARPYTAPRIVTLGTLSGLTSGGSGMSNEGSMDTDPTRHP